MDQVHTLQFSLINLGMPPFPGFARLRSGHYIIFSSHHHTFPFQYRFASACIYFLLGLLCFDRFTSQAFISEEDPVSATAIQLPREESYDSYESDRERRMRHYRDRDRSDPDGEMA